MSEDFEKIDEIFRIHDETVKDSVQPVPEKANDTATGLEAAVEKVQPAPKKKKKKAAPVSEREYRPVRQGRAYKTGCLGGLMYFTFILCLSIIFACVAWMAAADALALTHGSFEDTVILPTSIFSAKTVDVEDEDGNVTGTKKVSSADIDYVADTLKENGFIQYKWLFKFFCKISKADQKLDPGEYTLKSSFDYRALVKHMQIGAGAAKTVTVTIPEGFTMSQIFYRLEENGVCSHEELMEAAANATFNYYFLEGSEAGSASRLEGYLFPDTYEFYVGMNASSAIDKFLKNFSTRFDADLQNQLNAQGYSLADILSVASLIEKEAANDDERSVIASVIYNRLNSGWTLGLESAVLYLHQDHEGAPTQEMLDEDTPYNVMKNVGLPPTPICCPGLTSIKAALNPSVTNYYYFTLDTATGTHRFFTSGDEFNAFVATQNYG